MKLYAEAWLYMQVTENTRATAVAVHEKTRSAAADVQQKVEFCPNLEGRKYKEGFMLAAAEYCLSCRLVILMRGSKSLSMLQQH